MNLKAIVKPEAGNKGAWSHYSSLCFPLDAKRKKNYTESRDSRVGHQDEKWG